jgi:hypothetical protein
MTITDNDLPLHNDACDPNAPTPPDPATELATTDQKVKALGVLDMVLQRGVGHELDQLEIAVSLAAHTAARFMASNGIHDRGRRRVMVRNLIASFEKRLKNHLARVNDPAVAGTAPATTPAPAEAVPAEVG